MSPQPTLFLKILLALFSGIMGFLALYLNYDFLLLKYLRLYGFDRLELRALFLIVIPGACLYSALYLPRFVAQGKTSPISAFRGGLQLALIIIFLMMVSTIFFGREEFTSPVNPDQLFETSLLYILFYVGVFYSMFSSWVLMFLSTSGLTLLLIATCFIRARPIFWKEDILAAE